MCQPLDEEGQFEPIVTDCVDETLFYEDQGRCWWDCRRDDATDDACHQLSLHCSEEDNNCYSENWMSDEDCFHFMYCYKDEIFDMQWQVCEQPCPLIGLGSMGSVQEVFYNRVRECVIPDSPGECMDRSHPAPLGDGKPHFTCPDGEGKYENWADARTYFKCYYSDRQEMLYDVWDCPEGRVYDDEEKECM